MAEKPLRGTRGHSALRKRAHLGAGDRAVFLFFHGFSFLSLEPCPALGTKRKLRVCSLSRYTDGGVSEEGWAVQRTGAPRLQERCSGCRGRGAGRGPGTSDAGGWGGLSVETLGKGAGKRVGQPGIWFCLWERHKPRPPLPDSFLVNLDLTLENTCIRPSQSYCRHSGSPQPVSPVLSPHPRHGPQARWRRWAGALCPKPDPPGRSPAPGFLLGRGVAPWLCRLLSWPSPAPRPLADTG